MQLQSIMRKHLASYPAALYGLLFLVGVLITGAGHLLRLPFFTGCAAGVTVLFALYGLWGLSMHLAGGFRALRTCGKRALLGCLLLVAVIEVFFAVEMANQHTIYYWDQADYWQKTVEASQKLFTQPGYFLKQVYGSILNYDYNLLIPLVLALPTRIFGTAHITHILLIVNLFLLPAAFTLAVAARTLCAKKVPLPVLFGLSAFSPVLLYPALAGYLDSFSLLTLSIAFLVGSGQAVLRFAPQRCIVLALALVATMLGRRYFCYAAVGFLCGELLYVLLSLACRQAKRKEGLAFFKNLLLSGAIMIGILLCVWKFLVRVVSTSYAEQYKAYQTGNTLHNFTLLLQYFGLLFVVICLLDLVLAFKRRRFAFSAGMLCAGLLPAFLLFRVQSMGQHHYYITLLPLLLMQAHLLGCVSDWKVLGRRIASAAVCCCTALNFLFAYVPALHSAPSAPFIGTQRFLPLQRTDIPQLTALGDYVNALSEQEGGAKSYMLSASFRLNYSILQNVHAPDTFESVPSLFRSKEIDLRDGFPMEFLSADIVIISDPIQYPAPPEDSRVVGVLAQDILEDSPISTLYTKKASFSLEDGVTASVYLRSRAFNETELSFLKSQFQSFYPQWNLNFDTHS